jgi:hypothetical protein
MTLHNDIKHNDNQHYYIQHDNNKMRHSEYFDTQDHDRVLLCWVSFMQSVIYAECHLCWVSFMLIVTNGLFMLSVMMLSVFNAECYESNLKPS